MRLVTLSSNEVHVWVADLSGDRWSPSVLRRVLSSYLGQDQRQIELVVEENGKPRLAGDSDLEFNLSHSGGRALIAVSRQRRVGVDVEKEKVGRDLLGLSKRALAAEDASAVRAAAPSDRGAVFYAAWVRHEARLKCLGAGLFGPVPESPMVVQEVDVGPDYAAAVAVAGAEAVRLRLQTLPPD